MKLRNMIFIGSMLLLVFLSSLTFGQGKESSEELYFSDVYHCFDPDGPCLEDYFDSGQYVTLVSKNAKPCTALTGQVSDVDLGVDECRGTRLLQVKCKDPFQFDFAIIASKKDVIVDLEFLDLKDLIDRKVINGLIERFKQSEYYDPAQLKFLDESIPTVKVFPHPSQVIYIVDFDLPSGPPFIVSGDIIEPAFDIDSCGGFVRAFRLNQRYYAEFRSCGCETDACGNIVIEVTKLKHNAVTGRG